MEPSPSNSLEAGEKVPDQEVWSLIVHKIGEAAPSVAASLSESQVKSCKGDILSIIFQGNPFDLKRVQKPDNMDLISRMAREVIGAPVRVVFEADKVGRKQVQKKNSQQRKNELEKKALNHPMVEEARRIFEGEIVRVNIRQGDEDEGHG
jgi:hypothetical protein